MSVLYFVTGNQNKLREVQEILGDDIKIETVDIDLPELQGTPEDIASQKCKLAYDQLQKPCIVEDTSLCFNALNGMPGPYIKWFINDGDLFKLRKMLCKFDDKTAYAQCIFAMKMGSEEPMLFKGIVDGRIVRPRGDNKFGWDPVFQPDGFNQTFAELDPSEKNKISHRFRAIQKMKEYLSSKS